MKLAIKVVPGSSRAAVSKMADGTLKVNVTAPPEKGRANEEVRQLLAAHFAVPVAAVQIVAGHGNARKIVEVTG